MIKIILLSLISIILADVVPWNFRFGLKNTDKFQCTGIVIERAPAPHIFFLIPSEWLTHIGYGDNYQMDDLVGIGNDEIEDTRYDIQKVVIFEHFAILIIVENHNYGGETAILDTGEYGDIYSDPKMYGFEWERDEGSSFRKTVFDFPHYRDANDSMSIYDRSKILEVWPGFYEKNMTNFFLGNAVLSDISNHDLWRTDGVLVGFVTRIRTHGHETFEIVRILPYHKDIQIIVEREKRYLRKHRKHHHVTTKRPKKFKNQNRKTTKII